MNDKLDKNTEKNILKWFFFLPVAILAFFVPLFFFYFFLGFMMQGSNYTSENFYSGSAPISFLWMFFFILFSSFFLFVYTGTSIAPRNKKTVAIILSLFLIAPLTLYFYFTNFVFGTLNFLILDSLIYSNYAIIFGIIGIITANLAIKISGVGKYFAFSFVLLILVFGGLYFLGSKENFLSDKEFTLVEEHIKTCDMGYGNAKAAKCYAKAAITLNNYSICEELRNKDRLFVPGWVPSCYAEIAVTQQDKKVCDLIDDMKFPGYQEQCRSFVGAGVVGNFLHID